MHICFGPQVISKETIRIGSNYRNVRCNGVNGSDQTFGHAYSAVLSFENRKQMYIPRGFAHGCLTLEDDTLMQWCVDNDFCGEAAKAVRYDSDFVWQGESWPEGAYIISEKDRNAVRLENFCGR